MRQFASLLFALALLSMLAYASPQNFNMQWHPEIPSGGTAEQFPFTYLGSDLDTSPNVTMPPIICVGNPLPITFSATANWNVARPLDAGTANSAGDRTKLSSPSPSSGPYSVQWITGTQSNNLYTQQYFTVNRYFQRSASPDQWVQFLNNQGIPTSYPQYSIASYYKCPNGIPHYFDSDSGGANCVPPPTSPYTKYKASAALFCNAKAVISVSGGPTFNSDDFMGSNIVKTVNGLPLGVHTISGSLVVQRCMAPMLDEGTFSVKSTYVTIDNSFAPSYSFPTQTVSVENPFVCSLAATGGTYSPNPAPPSSTISFSFNLTNNGNKPVSVNSIALSSGSLFSNLIITSPSIPFTANNGASQPITGTVTVPSSPGTHQLKLAINSQSTTADCATGAIADCNVPALLIVDVIVSPGSQPNYVITSITARSPLFVNDNFDTTVDTSNIGAAPAASPSTTRVTLAGQVRNIAVPLLTITPPTNHFPGTVSLVCTPAGPNSIGATADATNIIPESNEGDNTASLLIVCNARPDTCTLAFVGHSPNFRPGESAPVRATCTSSGSPTVCPNLTWSQNAVGGSMNPVFTPRALNPTSTLSLNLSAPTPQNGRAVSATSAEAGLPLNCGALPFNVITNPAVSCVLASDHGPYYLISQQGTYNVTCFDDRGQLADCPGFTWTTNRGTMNPTNTPPFPPVPQSTFTAGSLGTGTIQATSVGVTPSFSCSPPVTVNVIPDQKPDYIISSIQVPNAVYVGERFNSQVSTKNIGTLNAASPSITIARFTPQLVNLDVPPLAISQVSTSNASFICQPVGANSVTASSDAVGGDPIFHQIIELNEGNNDGGPVPMTCFAIPDSCSLDFFTNGGGTGNGPLGPTTFGANDSSDVKATCTAGGLPTLCPNFTWSQNAIGGSMFPIFTPRQMNPVSTLTLHNAPDQTGREVRATSVDPTVPGLTCFVPFNVNSGGGGNGTGNFTLACSLVNHGPVFFSGESAQVQADCLLNGVANCPALNWNTNLRLASMNPLSTPAGRSPKFSTFSVGTVTANANGSITVSCADPSVCGSTSCSIDVGVFLTPNSLICTIENHSNTFTSVDSATIRGECFGATRNPTACPDLHWTTNITRANLVPTDTPAMLRPSTLFSTRGSPPQSGVIDAVSTDPRFPLLRCNPAINASVVSSMGPDYTAKVQTNPVLVPIGDIVHLTVKTSNIGNAPGGVASSTNTVITPADCSPPTRRAIPSLNPGDTDTLAFDCPCTTPGRHNVVSEADSTRVIADTDRTNNIGTATYYCAGNYTFSCSDYV